jgi:hypothetical protein
MQDALQNQHAPSVIVQQVPPPYNPAAVSQLASSEVIDESAITASNPPPTYV